MKILIVEDNNGDQVLLAEAFGTVNPEIRLDFALTVDGAFKKLRKSQHGPSKDQIRLVIADLNLPGKSGKDFLTEIKKDAVLKRMPILVLSSSDAEKDITDCYAAGASGYIIKPLGLTELERMVKSLCDFWFKEVTFPRIY